MYITWSYLQVHVYTHLHMHASTELKLLHVHVHVHVPIPSYLPPTCTCTLYSVVHISTCTIMYMHTSIYSRAARHTLILAHIKFTIHSFTPGSPFEQKYKILRKARGRGHTCPCLLNVQYNCVSLQHNYTCKQLNTKL